MQTKNLTVEQQTDREIRRRYRSDLVCGNVSIVYAGYLLFADLFHSREKSLISLLLGMLLFLSLVYQLVLLLRRSDAAKEARQQMDPVIYRASGLMGLNVFSLVFLAGAILNIADVSWNISAGHLLVDVGLFGAGTMMLTEGIGTRKVWNMNRSEDSAEAEETEVSND